MRMEPSYGERDPEGLRSGGHSAISRTRNPQSCLLIRKQSRLRERPTR